MDKAVDILGSNPIAADLKVKAEAMLGNVPCLMDLKSKSLRERHWKAISEAVGAEVKASKVRVCFRWV